MASELASSLTSKCKSPVSFPNGNNFVDNEPPTVSRNIMTENNMILSLRSVVMIYML